jgi:hypothetical protein
LVWAILNRPPHPTNLFFQPFCFDQRFSILRAATSRPYLGHYLPLLFIREDFLSHFSTKSSRFQQKLAHAFAGCAGFSFILGAVFTL